MKELNEKLYEAKLVYYTPTLMIKSGYSVPIHPARWQPSIMTRDWR